MNIMIYHASRFFHKQIFLTQIIAKLLCPQTQTGHNFQQIYLPSAEPQIESFDGKFVQL